MEEAKKHIQRPANEQGSSSTGQSRAPEITMKMVWSLSKEGHWCYKQGKKIWRNI